MVCDAHKLELISDVEKKWLDKDLNPKDPNYGILRHFGDLIAHYSEKQQAYLNKKENKDSTAKEPGWIRQEQAHRILKETIGFITSVNTNYKKNNQIN